MHPGLQAKLLRAIQERVIDRIGGTSPVKIDIRLIATSNRDLEAYVKSGNFREDLYHRLNVINLALPALRERPSDIVPLAQLFADKYSEQNGLPKKKISATAAQNLKAHHWQGNIRELENTMHRAVLMSQEDEIEATAVHLTGQKAAPVTTTVKETAQAVVEKASAEDSAPASGGGQVMVGRTVADVERELILNTLTHCLGNRTHAANILGISIRTLRNKLKEYGEQETING